ncbi:RNF11 [Bugula neritina]|uniref:RNF11 n=1 Tax=Bugula neritina TaxID=10212 RepID=A0A7J7JQT4_BUGNE|nr:RNF11 [Bugula neritina]
MGAGCCALSDSDAADDTSPFDREDHNYSHQQSTLSQRRGVHIEAAQHVRHRGPSYFLPTASPLQFGRFDDENAEQIRAAQKRRIIDLLESRIYKQNVDKQCVECSICLTEFETGDQVKHLPCMHIYHKHCIDDWLSRSLNCPSCMEPVDAALFSSFGTFGGL